VGLGDFSRLAHEFAARFKGVRQKQGVSPSIEMLEGLLIFPDLHAKLPSDSRKSDKNTAFSRQSKRFDAFRYGKINKPWTHSAT
jgi:hypothetical protein